jgi:hypothetical protein
LQRVSRAAIPHPDVRIALWVAEYEATGDLVCVSEGPLDRKQNKPLI